MNDDINTPVSEPSVAENEDPDEDEKAGGRFVILWLRDLEILSAISCDRA